MFAFRGVFVTLFFIHLCCRASAADNLKLKLGSMILEQKSLASGEIVIHSWKKS